LISNLLGKETANTGCAILEVFLGHGKSSTYLAFQSVNPSILRRNLLLSLHTTSSLNANGQLFRMLTRRSRQNDIQNVLRRSSSLVLLRVVSAPCVSRSSLSILWRPRSWTSRHVRPRLIQPRR
jgi:hypothetical protein